jgi:hypothetical protein
VPEEAAPEEAAPEEAAPVSEQAVPVSEEAAPVSEAPVSEDEDTPYLLSEEHGLEAAVPASSKRPHRSRESPPW